LDGLPTLQREFDADAIDLFGETALLQVLIGQSVGGFTSYQGRPMPVAATAADFAVIQ
jgi:hypothetical protein